MNNITIVTDSASDLDSTTFFEKIKGKNIFPKTAQVQPYAFEKIFERELSEEFNITDFMIGEIGPSVGSHSGPEALAVLFISK